MSIFIGGKMVVEEVVVVVILTVVIIAISMLGRRVRITTTSHIIFSYSESCLPYSPLPSTNRMWQK